MGEVKTKVPDIRGSLSSPRNRRIEGERRNAITEFGLVSPHVFSTGVFGLFRKLRSQKKSNFLLNSALRRQVQNFVKFFMVFIT